MTVYYTYILRCADGSLYTGVTTDLARRFREHCGGGRGAKYTASHCPVRFEAAWSSPGRAEASRLEYRIKRFSRAEKELIISGEHRLSGEPEIYTRAELTDDRTDMKRSNNMEKYLGESIPKLGFGLMRLPKDGEVIDVGQVRDMSDMFLEAGFKYFDTSWAYQGSEAAFGDAVGKRLPRDKYILATKCPVWLAKDRDEAHNMLNVSLERTGAGYIDFYLLHNLGEQRTHFFDDYGIWDLVQEQKQKGLVRHVGFSFHDKADLLDKILTEHPETEFVQLQINYADWENPAVESRKCYETARRHGKPVVIMEPVKGGTLAKLPPNVSGVFTEVDDKASMSSWAVRYAASLEGIVTVLSGMSNVEQMRDNISYMKSFKPLTETEKATVERARTILESYRSIPCTSCRYCMEVCPQQVAVPGIFEAMNVLEMYGDKEAAKGRYSWNTDGHKLKKGSDCIKCGQCENVCPQHIKIRDELAKAVAELENKE